jgi:hypothetical protein
MMLSTQSPNNSVLAESSGKICNSMCFSCKLIENSLDFHNHRLTDEADEAPAAELPSKPCFEVGTAEEFQSDAPSASVFAAGKSAYKSMPYFYHTTLVEARKIGLRSLVSLRAEKKPRLSVCTCRVSTSTGEPSFFFPCQLVHRSRTSLSLRQPSSQRESCSCCASFSITP